MARWVMIDDAAILAWWDERGRGTQWQRKSGRICCTSLDATTMVVRVGSGSDRDEGSGSSGEGSYLPIRSPNSLRQDEMSGVWWVD